jgi:hypothetical protein
LENRFDRISASFSRSVTRVNPSGTSRWNSILFSSACAEKALQQPAASSRRQTSDVWIGY